MLQEVHLFIKFENMKAIQNIYSGGKKKANNGVSSKSLF